MTSEYFLSDSTSSEGGSERQFSFRLRREREERTATFDASDAEHGENGSSGVRVIVDSSVESGRRILAEASLDERLSSGVLVHKGRDVVDEARDDDEVAGLGSFLDCERTGSSVPGSEEEGTERNAHSSQVRTGRLFEVEGHSIDFPCRWTFLSVMAYCPFLISLSGNVLS